MPLFNVTSFHHVKKNLILCRWFVGEAAQQTWHRFDEHGCKVVANAKVAPEEMEGHFCTSVDVMITVKICVWVVQRGGGVANGSSDKENHCANLVSLCWRNTRCCCLCLTFRKLVIAKRGLEGSFGRVGGSLGPGSWRWPWLTLSHAVNGSQTENTHPGIRAIVVEEFPRAGGE